jgi:hypothetical protein
MDGANEFFSRKRLENGWFSVLRCNPFRKNVRLHVQLYRTLLHLALTLRRRPSLYLPDGDLPAENAVLHLSSSGGKGRFFALTVLLRRRLFQSAYS